MNQDERRAILSIHKKYPDYELALADFIDWCRKYNWKEDFPNRKFNTPEKIAEEFEKSEYFKKDEK